MLHIMKKPGRYCSRFFTRCGQGCPRSIIRVIFTHYMPTLTQREIRERAVTFAHEWQDEARERAEAQTFWNGFFHIFGIERRRVAVFESPVKMLGERGGSIDLFWKGVMVAEHKSRGRDLDKAFTQATDYFQGIKDAELPKYVLVSDFARFRLYDLEEDTQVDFPLTELPNRIDLFGFISGYTKRTYKDQDPVNIDVALKMGALHDALEASGYTGHKLEQFLIRLVYCLFADDTGIFQPRGSFDFFVEQKTAEDGSNLGAMLSQLFQVLDTPEDERQANIDKDLAAFPYVNGALFKERFDMPFFSGPIRKLLLEACAVDWSKVSPAVFGSLFQSVMDEEERRHLGAHYTSEKNILKLVRGLFLDELWTEFETVKNNTAKLRQFHDKIAGLKFFDPACGCGNFLVITYREMRQLEIEVLKQLQRSTGTAQLELDVTKISKLDVDSYYGIELEEFPARIAEVALWVTDHQMNMALSAEFGNTVRRLPLKKTPNIHHANALRVNWHDVLSPRFSGPLSSEKPPEGGTQNTTLYILGNPPFIGKSGRTDEQTADMAYACGEVNNFASLDFVCAWYIKAAQFIQGTRVKCAFVATNSITQGEQVGILWSYLFSRGIKIHFAHRTFKWRNESRNNAAVFCVIIGFAAFDTNRKYLFDYERPDSEPFQIQAVNINPYLIDFEDFVIANRGAPIGAVPPMVKGSQPTDDGNLLLNDEEKRELLEAEPKAEKFVKPFISAHEFLNGKSRWCLWLQNAPPNELRTMPEVMRRIENVRKFRLASRKAATVRLADVPYLFAEIRQPDSDFILVPRHSSENRKYIPFAFFGKDNIVADSSNSIPNATLYHFGVLTSVMHMAWMRQVCGRLKSDYRYSNKLVYNNFPFPREVTERNRERVAQAAQSVLDARAAFPGATLADLYDPNAMPRELLDAHRAVDAAVDACYGKRAFATELERLKFLFELYRQYTDPLAQLAEKETRKAKRRKK